MEDKTKIKIKTALTTNNQWKTQQKQKTTKTSIYQQPLEDNRKIKTALTTNNQWKTKQKQKQHQQVFTNSHQKTTEK